MKVRIIGKKDCPAYERSRAIVEGRGHTVVGDNDPCDLSIAPWLTDILTWEKIYEPKYGTLIFHPSPLPYGRGRAAIKFAYKRRDPITAATWLWANIGVDCGDICEMEILKIDHTLSPRDFYAVDVLPALERTLSRALEGVEEGRPRHIPQIERYATYDRVSDLDK